MSVWIKRLSIIFSIVAIFIVAGCETSMEKPLTKDEASEFQGAQDAGEREISIAADVKPPEMDAPQAEEKEKESKDSSESDSGSDEEETVRNEEGSEEGSDTGASNNGSGSDGDSSSSNSTDNKSESTGSNKQEKSTKDSSNSNNSSSGKQQESSNQNNNTSNKDTNKESNKKSETPKDTLVYSIVISDSEIPLPPTEVEVKEGDSVLDVLIRITKDKGIQMDYRGGQGGSAYVEGIENVYEFDRGQGSGWMYRVNGVFPDRGAGVVPLLPDDRVEWLYTTDLGKDLGADLKPFRR